MCKRHGRGFDYPAALTLAVIAALAGLYYGMRDAGGTEVSRQRDYYSERSVERITAGLGLGALVGAEKGMAADSLRLARSPVFYVDGEQATLWRALLRMLLYVVDFKGAGEVQYNYALTYNGLQINRWTIIRAGYVHAITIIPSPAARMSWARLDTYANESSSGTRIRNQLTISTPYGNRCGLVRRIVYREAIPLMDKALWTIEDKAVKLFEAGRTSPIVRAFADWYLRRSNRR